MDDAGRYAARYVVATEWCDLPEPVRLRAVMCSIDMFGALVAGSAAPVVQIGRRIAVRCFSGSEASILMSSDQVSLPGAALANGLAANALDIDDGHRMVKGHPGAVVFPALLAVAEYRKVRLQDFLAALVAAYEIALRAGLTLQAHYAYYHSSGAWGAVGAAAGAAKLMGFEAQQVLQAMAIADFHAPMVPVMRSVRCPSMSKDGVGWGAMTGMLAVLMAADGFVGGHSLFSCPEGHARVMDLGSVHEIMNIYFKSHACCRWAHPAIDAVVDLQRAHGLSPAEVAAIRIRTFAAAAALYRQKPDSTEQAQYNMVYPVAAAMVAGRVGPGQILGEGFHDPAVVAMMDRVAICVDDRFEREFPARRLCEVEIVLKNGGVRRSGIYSSDGDRDKPVSLGWIIDKFHRLVGGLLSAARARELVALLTAPEANPSVDRLIRLVTDA